MVYQSYIWNLLCGWISSSEKINCMLLCGPLAPMFFKQINPQDHSSCTLECSNWSIIPSWEPWQQSHALLPSLGLVVEGYQRPSAAWGSQGCKWGSIYWEYIHVYKSVCWLNLMVKKGMWFSACDFVFSIPLPAVYSRWFPGIYRRVIWRLLSSSCKSKMLGRLD